MEEEVGGIAHAPNRHPPPPKKNQTCVCGGSFFCSAKTKKETLVSNTPFYISIGKSPPHVRKHRHTLLCLVSVSVCVCVRVSHHCVRDPFWFGTVWGWLDGLNTVVAYGTDSSFFYSYPLVLEEKKSKCASLDEKRHIFCLVVVMRSCGTVVELYHSTSKKFHRHTTSPRKTEFIPPPPPLMINACLSLVVALELLPNPVVYTTLQGRNGQQIGQPLNIC